ncbi:carboxypeptidase regulatory-like domain-containing protein [Paenibacillus hodogayensis]|uniref:Carboxypeptidase regulatory-like domain-containing protein n=1 Tax=Paenibacillus hodogayensis TaxID=279208 RepID=A0ABV5VQK1_9BACL
MGKRFKFQTAVCLAAVLLLQPVGVIPPAAEAASGGSGLLAEAPEPVAYDSGKWAVLPKWGSAPAIDGSLDETVWGSAAKLGDFKTAFYSQSLSQEAEYRVAYDDNQLYIGGSIALTEADTLASIDILLRPSAGADDYYAVKIPLPTAQAPVLTTIWNPSPDVAYLAADEGKHVVGAFTYATSVQSDRRIVEAAVPLSSIAPGGVLAGDEWRLNIMHVHNLYTQPLSSWVPVRQSDHWHNSGPDARMRASVIDQDRMGTVYFSRLPESIVGGGTAMLPWHPNEAGTELLYRGFTEKRLKTTLTALQADGLGQMDAQTLKQSSVELTWKEPGGVWQSLGQYAWSEDGGFLQLDFQHPAPLATGTYQLGMVFTPNPATGKGVARLTFDREALVSAGSSAYEPEPETRVTTLVYRSPSAEVQRIKALIPPQPGFIFVGLPEMPELYPGGLYTLSADGLSLKASRTGTVYPNAQFVEDKTLSVTNAKGETVSIPYYEDASGKRYFITAHLWYLQKSRAISQTAALLKSDPLGAARLLYAFAKAYEGYNPTVDRVAGSFHANLSADKRSGPPYAYWGGIWERWWYSDLPQLTPLIKAYAELKRTNAFALLNAEAGEDVEQRIVQGMIVPTAEFVLTYPDYLGNMSFQPWKGLIEVGKALGEPDYMHRVVELIGSLATRMFLSDGYWQEVTPSYHLQTVNGLRDVANQLKGWSDPPGYVSPRTGIRFDNLDMEQLFPVIRRAVDNANKLVYPDGKVVPITDTWANNRPPDPQIDAGSFLLPAAKIGRLAGGTGPGQTQLYMGFQPKYGHEHYDPLNLNLYAKGQELLPDLGYTHNSFYRWFALSTMGHNTVVVDSKNMVNGDKAKQGGNAEAFVTEGGLFQAMRADYKSAYGVTETYSREPWFVPFEGGGGEQGYVLDLFRVKGGSRHEYTLQGDANRDAEFATDMPLTDYGPYLLPPGTNVVQPTSNSDSGSAEGQYPGYIYVRDVKQAQLNGDRYEVTLVTQSGGKEQAKLNITGLLEPGSNELYLGRSPSLRSIRLQGSAMDNNDEVVKYTMPKLVLRRDGTNLQSTFMTVLEPFRGREARIEAIDRLPLEQAPEGAAAVRVVYGDTTDILLSNPAHPELPMTTGDVTMVGEMGLIRLKDGEVREMSLSGGTLLQKGDRQITGAGLAMTGIVGGTKRAAKGDAYDALVVDAAIPEAAAGDYIFVSAPDHSTTGFQIGQVLRDGAKSIVVLAEQDPGFEIMEDGTSGQTFYPGRSWTGTHTFSWSGTVSAQVYGGPPPLTSSVTGAVYTENGTPIPGAAVHVTGYTNLAAVTDANGMFTIPHIPAGKQRVTASSDGYARNVSDAVYAAPGQTSNVSLTLSSLPPVLKEVTPALVAKGDPVNATGNSDGTVHLVPAGTPPVKASIETVSASVYGARAQATANVPAVLSTTALSGGKYSVYLINDRGLVSPSKEIVILPTDVERMEDTSPYITYVGKWELFSSSNYSGGTLTLGREKGAYMEIPFYGASAKVIADLHTARGKGKIYVDGVYAATIDFYSSPIRYKQEVFDTGPLEEGVHVIRLEALWEKQPSSTGYNASFDALQVMPSDVRLTGVTAGALVQGDALTATSSRSGTLYLIPAATPAERSEIEQAGAGAGGRNVPVAAGVPGSLNTSGLPVGWYQVYAIDAKGIVSRGSDAIAIVAPQQQPAVVEDSDPMVRYTGDWRSYSYSAYSGGTMKLAFEKNAYADIPFYGTAATLVTDRHTARGKGAVYVDGVYAGVIDFYNNPILYKQEVFQTGPLAPGAHVLRIEALWQHAAGSTGNVIPFDALKVTTN